MEALDLVMLGRRLARIGERAMRAGELRAADSSGRAVPTGVRLVLSDVFRNPGSSITEITTRTGLRQSHVSAAVAALREQRVLQTAPDPRDGRRTLVSVTDEHPRRVVRAGAAPVDGALAQALGGPSPDELRAIIAALQDLAGRLTPLEPGPIVRRLEQARHDAD